MLGIMKEGDVITTMMIDIIAREMSVLGFLMGI
jgi:hypothetical protein